MATRFCTSSGKVLNNECNFLTTFKGNVIVCLQMEGNVLVKKIKFSVR
jgi:hypothetical protein